MMLKKYARRIWYLAIFVSLCACGLSVKAAQNNKVGTVKIIDRIVCTDGSGETYDIWGSFARDFEEYIFPGTSYRFEDNDEEWNGKKIGIASETPVVSGKYDGSGALNIVFIYRADRANFERIKADDYPKAHGSSGSSGVICEYKYYHCIALDENKRPDAGWTFKKQMDFEDMVEWSYENVIGLGNYVIGSWYDDDEGLFYYNADRGYAPTGTHKDKYGNYQSVIFSNIKTDLGGKKPLYIYDPDKKLVATVVGKNYNKPILTYGEKWPNLGMNDFIIDYKQKNYKITITTKKEQIKHLIPFEFGLDFQFKPVYVTIQKLPQKLSASNVSLSAKSYVYNGKVRKPSVKVKDNKGKVVSAANYQVSYAKGRKNVGKYNVKITFKGKYTGSVTKSFTIHPKGTSISRLSAGKKKLTVKWKKQTRQTTGYQLQYSTNKKFKSGNKTVTISKNKTASKKLSRLKAKKRYYVRIRTYKTLKINGKTTRLYSNWSKAKSIKVK